MTCDLVATDHRDDRRHLGCHHGHRDRHDRRAGHHREVLRSHRRHRVHDHRRGHDRRRDRRHGHRAARSDRRASSAWASSPDSAGACPDAALLRDRHDQRADVASPVHRRRHREADGDGWSPCPDSRRTGCCRDVAGRDDPGHRLDDPDRDGPGHHPAEGRDDRHRAGPADVVRAAHRWRRHAEPLDGRHPGGRTPRGGSPGRDGVRGAPPARDEPGSMSPRTRREPQGPPEPSGYAFRGRVFRVWGCRGLPWLPCGHRVRRRDEVLVPDGRRAGRGERWTPPSSPPVQPSQPTWPSPQMRCCRTCPAHRRGHATCGPPVPRSWRTPNGRIPPCPPKF